MAFNRENFIDQIGKMTVLELADLVKSLEEAFGVSAAMPMAQAAAPVAAAAQAQKEEKAEYKVVIKDSGDQKIAVIKELRKLVSGLSLTDAKKMVEETPSTVVESIAKDEAFKMKSQLEAAGAKVELL